MGMTPQTSQTQPHNDNSRPRRTAVFIDGAHLSVATRRDFPGVAIAFDKLAALLAGPTELVRTYYYDAPPYLPYNPSEQDRHRYAQRRRFYEALRHYPRFEVREGRIARTVNRHTGGYEYVQKYVDVWLSTDLVRLASKRQIDLAILVTADSDFVPAIRAAREEGVEVRLLSSRSPRAVHPELAAAVDARMFLDDAMVQQTARRAA
jgi:uncharacterized LabA/DUF88 family protein